MYKTKLNFEERFFGITDSYKFSPINTFVNKFPNYFDLDNFLAEKVENLDLNDLKDLNDYILEITFDGSWICKENLDEKGLISKIDEFLESNYIRKNSIKLPIILKKL